VKQENKELNKHLTDNEIQGYLDDGNIVGNSAIAGHLSNCESCRLKVKQYEALFGSLATDTAPELSVDFTESVMSKIESIPLPEPSLSPDPVRKIDMVMVYGLVGALAGLIITAIFVDLEKLFGIAKLDLSVAFFDGWASRMIASFNSNMPVDLELVFGVLMVLAVIKVVDYIIQHNRRRLATFVV